MRKRILRIAVALVLAAAVAVGLYARKLARIGVGYAAEQTCACLFISGRTLDSCRLDLDRIAQRVVTIEPSHDEVHARSLGVSATARYQSGFGCGLID